MQDEGTHGGFCFHGTLRRLPAASPNGRNNASRRTVECKSSERSGGSRAHVVARDCVNLHPLVRTNAMRPSNELFRARRRFAHRRGALLVCAGLLLAAFACGDPYQHTNPYDPAVPVEIDIGGPDTVFSYAELAQFMATTIPAFRIRLLPGPSTRSPYRTGAGTA